MADLFRVGVITSPHGVHGEVNVYPTTDDPDRFRQIKDLQVETKTGLVLMDVESVKYFKGMAILKLSGIRDRNEAECHRNQNLWIRREQSSPCRPGEYFISDIMDMEVVLEDGTHYGVIRDVLTGGANDVYEVRKDDGKSVLLPMIPSCVLNVNVEEKKMTVYVLPGLED